MGKAPREIQGIVPPKEKLGTNGFPAIFPYDKTGNLTINFGPKENSFFTTTFDTTTKSYALTPRKDWPEGKYLAILTTRDKDGNEITDKVFFDLKAKNLKQVPDNQYFKIITDKNSYQPGEQVQIHTGSAAPNTYIRVWIEKNHQIIDEKLIKTDGNYHNLSIPVNEKDRGGFAIHYTYYAFNDFIKGNKIIEVAFPSKKLQIETLTFRDKLQPGQKEECRFKIKGPKGEKVAAEDVSLFI